MIKIAVDAMGSDRAPGVEVDGAVQAASQLGVPIVLVGQESAVRPLLEKHDVTGLPIEIVHASEVVTMEDSASTAVRRKKDSSIRVAENLMRDGKVSGVVSAGNTGAVMATAKFIVGTLPVVDRPALSTVLPTQKGKPCILLDVGANVDCKPLHLEQFAIMGEALELPLGQRLRHREFKSHRTIVAGHELWEKEGRFAEIAPRGDLG